MSKKIGTHPTLFLVPTRFARHPVLTEAMNLSGSIKSGRGLNRCATSDVLRNYVLRVVQLAEAKASVNIFTEPTLQQWQFGCV